MKDGQLERAKEILLAQNVFIKGERTEIKEAEIEEEKKEKK